MKIEKLPGGLYPVMLTPFLDNNKVDVVGLKTLTRYYMQSGANGLFSNCLSSEMFQLTDEERLLVVQTVVETASGKVPVVAAGTFHSSIEKNAEFIKRVYDKGVAAVIVISNQIVDMDESDDIFKKRITSLMKLTGDIPLGIYECPYPYKRLISPDMIHWLSETEHFIYHKDTSCDPLAIKEKFSVIKNELFSFFNADTPTALGSLREGIAGLSPIGANLYPELYSSLINGFNAHKAEEELEWLSARLTVMDTVVDLSYPFSAKYFLQQKGLPVTNVCRINYDKVRPSGRLKLHALMKLYKDTVNRLEINKAYAHN